MLAAERSMVEAQEAELSLDLAVRAGMTLGLALVAAPSWA